MSWPLADRRARWLVWPLARAHRGRRGAVAIGPSGPPRRVVCPTSLALIRVRWLDLSLGPSIGRRHWWWNRGWSGKPDAIGRRGGRPLHGRSARRRGERRSEPTPRRGLAGRDRECIVRIGARRLGARAR